MDGLLTRRSRVKFERFDGKQHWFCSSCVDADYQVATQVLLANLSLGGDRFSTELRQCEASQDAYVRPAPPLSLRPYPPS